MGKKSQKTTGKKKKRISKHVLHSKQQGADEEQGGGGGGDQAQQQSSVSTADKPTQVPQTSKNKHVKDPEEAATYLQDWKESKTMAKSSWKFNKNTQSWLIRHMYQVDKVPKREFELLMEYLEGLQGSTTKSRIVADATRRAKRYKELAKKMEENEGEKKKSDGDGGGDEDDEKSTGGADQARGSNKDLSLTKEEMEYEENRWLKLSDHDKRKEYKRARKILDLIKL
jgi:hypothetical protein